MSNGTITMTGAEYDALAGKIAALESELATVKKVAYGNIELLEENQNLKAENAKLRERREPVACHVCHGQGEGWTGENQTFGYMSMQPPEPIMEACPECGGESATQQPSAAPDGWKLVPVEPTEEMVSAAEEAHMPFGDMDIALRMATLSAPSPSATVQGARWIPVSQQLPKQNEKVLVTYTNQLGNCRRVIAELVAKHTVEASDDCWGDGADYDEATDQYYCPAGWYECVENWDELAYLAVHEGEVTHWMPLPAAPAIDAARKGEGK